jgi:hypothetical protein
MSATPPMGFTPKVPAGSGPRTPFLVKGGVAAPPTNGSVPLKGADGVVRATEILVSPDHPVRSNNEWGYFLVSRPPLLVRGGECGPLYITSPLLRPTECRRP